MLESRNQLWMNSPISDRDSHQILKAAAVYFGIVFGLGFVLGAIRVLWIVPFLGLRNAELLEQPLMLIAVGLTAKRIVAKFAQRLNRPELLIVGLIALGILLLAEVIVVLLVQPVRAGDTISGIAYFINLGMFAIMPWLISQGVSIREKRRSSRDSLLLCQRVSPNTPSVSVLSLTNALCTIS